MAWKITAEYLRRRFALVAKLYGWDTEPRYGFERNKDGSLKARPNNYQMHRSGGWNINKTGASGNGETDIFRANSGAEMDAWFTAMIYVADTLIRDIQGALNTAEVGKNLVEVARAAHHVEYATAMAEIRDREKV